MDSLYGQSLSSRFLLSSRYEFRRLTSFPNCLPTDTKPLLNQNFTKRYAQAYPFKELTLTYLGLFFTYTTLPQGFQLAKKYFFKKTFFSFLRPNEAKLNLLFSHKKFSLFKFAQAQNCTFPKFNNSEYYLYNYTLFNFFKVYSAFTSLFSQGPRHSVVRNAGINSSFFSPRPPQMSDIKIPRIKFKPGYQKLWRRYRTALKESLQVRFIYQKQLTKYLTKFFRKATFYTFSQNELTLARIVISAKLLPDLYAVNLFLKHKLLFLNGAAAHSSCIFTFKGDLVQLELSSAHYIFFKWLANWSTAQDKKFKKLAFQKSLPSKYTLSKTKKQRSHYTPH